MHRWARRSQVARAYARLQRAALRALTGPYRCCVWVLLHRQEDPGRRAAMRAGHARTLMSSYKRGYYMHSEFVFPPEWAPRGGGVDDDDDDARPRFFTPRECARLQGFPEAFALDGLANINRLYHHLGNAVSPPIIAAIGGSMMAAAKPTEVEDAALSENHDVPSFRCRRPLSKPPTYNSKKILTPHTLNQTNATHCHIYL